NVRIIAAANTELRARSVPGQFPPYPPCPRPLRTPETTPLRGRSAPLRALAAPTPGELAQRSARACPPRAGVAEALERYGWPGNVRELRNALERGLLLSSDGTVTLDLLPAEIRGEPSPASRDEAARLEDLEKRHIQRVLESVDGNRTRAAEL